MLMPDNKNLKPIIKVHILKIHTYKKEEQIKSMVNRRREVIRIRGEINGI